MLGRSDSVGVNTGKLLSTVASFVVAGLPTDIVLPSRRDVGVGSVVAVSGVGAIVVPAGNTELISSRRKTTGVMTVIFVSLLVARRGYS